MTNRQKFELWEKIASRYRVSEKNQCVVCGKHAKHVYGMLSHTDSVVCSKKCSDIFIDVVTTNLDEFTSVTVEITGAI